MSFFKKINVTIARTNVVLYRVKLKKKKKALVLALVLLKTALDC